MANYIKLPSKGTTAKREFQRLLNASDETLVLVLWDDETAVAARAFVKGITDSDVGNSDIFRFTNFLVVANPNLILDDLGQLEGTKVDLSRIDEFVLISISPFRNILSEAVTKERFNRGKGSVSTAILRAIANG